jgi:hypothetical protein
VCSFSLIDGLIAAVRDWALRQEPLFPNLSDSPVIQRLKKTMARQLSRSHHPYQADRIRPADAEALIRLVHAACCMASGSGSGSSLRVALGKIQRIGAVLRLNLGRFTREGDKMLVTAQSHKTAQEGVTPVPGTEEVNDSGTASRSRLED